MKNYNFIIDNNSINKRLDIFLLENMENISRSRIKNLLDNGSILLNGEIAKAGYNLKVNDSIVANIPEDKPLNVLPEDISIQIVYQDKDLLVINKPQGMVVHPANGNTEHTLVNALLYNVKDLSGINGIIRPGIVHRLDKLTSGLLLVAKNDIAHISLSQQISEKTCHRNYKAILVGNLKEDSGTIQTYIGRDTKDRKKMAVTSELHGKLAITNYNVLERFDGYCFVEFELKTGRTHQIRVHAKSLGCPILGDTVYGIASKKFKLEGQLLHAYKISFIQPTTKQLLTFEVPLPDYFNKILTALRSKK